MAITIHVKKTAAAVMARAGVLRRLKQARLKNKAVVLMYHRVLSPGDPEIQKVQPGMFVSEDSFKIHAALLSREFTVIPLGELVHRLGGGQSLQGCCSITFDDGWRDNYQVAFPILKKWRLPATIFLATGLIGTHRRFWPDEVSGLLRQHHFQSSLRDGSGLARLVSEAGNRFKDQLFIEKAISALKAWCSEDREAFIAELKAGRPESAGERPLLNWEEVREMKASGIISFGSHTVNHVILDRVSKEEAEMEIRQSQKDLVSFLGEPSGLFAYPNGNTHDGIKEILVRCGFEGAVMTRKGFVDNGAQPLDIPRIALHEDVSSTAPLAFSRILIQRF